MVNKKEIRILNWNVNGLRAAYRKGFIDWLKAEKPDVMCVQEGKAHLDQLPKKMIEVDGYDFYLNSAERKGYSGVASWCAIEPVSVTHGFGIEKFDVEGRVQELDFGDFVLFNVYFPNGGASPERLAYKMEFYAEFLEHLKGLNPKKKNIIVCGDVNTAHKEIDLARPEANTKSSGFLPEERAWIDELLEADFYDAFRMFDESAEKYSWWDYKTKSRERNVGWRIDYFFVSEAIKDKITDCKILAEVPGSDHCPVELTLGV
ncbi:MAG: exodeoxyribonuclease III [Phycisphaerae bacterium]|nr:exodeoxyribonuclease III [Phycisphaerae bacterium]